jgi:hypothetical protein
MSDSNFDQMEETGEDLSLDAGDYNDDSNQNLQAQTLLTPEVVAALATAVAQMVLPRIDQKIEKALNKFKTEIRKELIEAQTERSDTAVSSTKTPGQEKKVDRAQTERRQSIRLEVPGDSIEFTPGELDQTALSGITTIQMKPQSGKGIKIEEFEYPVNREKLLSWRVRYATYKNKCTGAKIDPADMISSFDKRSLDVLRRYLSRYREKDYPRTYSVTDADIEFIISKCRLETSGVVEERKLAQLGTYLEKNYPAISELNDPMSRVYTLFELMDTYLDENNMLGYLELNEKTKYFREQIVQTVVKQIKPQEFREAVERTIRIRPELRFDPRKLEPFVIATAEQIQSTWDVLYPDGKVQDRSQSLEENSKSPETQAVAQKVVVPAPNSAIKCIGCSKNHFYGIQPKGSEWQKNCPVDYPADLEAKYREFSLKSIQEGLLKKQKGQEKQAKQVKFQDRTGKDPPASEPNRDTSMSMKDSLLGEVAELKAKLARAEHSEQAYKAYSTKLEKFAPLEALMLDDD